MSTGIKRLFAADYPRYEGVPPINVYLMRLVYVLMLVFLGKETWTHILSHQGEWQPLDAMAWSVWTAFATLAVLGVFHTVRMIPLLLLEVFYKLLWLALVAYPLWKHGTMAGSAAEGMTGSFVWVLLPIVAIPWPYVVRTFILGRKARAT